MFIILLVILFIIIGVIVVIVLINTLHKIVIYKDKVKYKMSDSDSRLFKKYSVKMKINELLNDNVILFCTDLKWNAKDNNNYCFLDNKSSCEYCIITKGYYYYVNTKMLVIQNNFDILFFDSIKYSNIINIIK